MLSVCPECKSKDIIRDYRHNRLVCGECGLILNSIYDDSYRPFRERKFRKREFNHKTFKIKRISRMNFVDERGLKVISRWIKHCCSQLDLPPYLEREAMDLAKRGDKKDLQRGRSRKDLAAAAVYLIARREQIPVTEKEILEISGLEESIFRSMYRELIRVFKVKIPMLNLRKFVAKYSSQLNMDIKLETKVYDLIEKLEKTRYLLGKNPYVILSALFYIVSKRYSNPRLTQEEIAKAFDVTEVSLRKHAKNLKGL